MAGSSSVAGAMDVASEHIAEDGEDGSICIMMKLISFNFGIHQDMFQDKNWRKRHSREFEFLMDTFTDDYNADVVLGCEVGGHKQGLDKKLQTSLNLRNLNVSFMQNYMTALSLTYSVSQQPITEINLTDSLLTELAGTTALDTQLVMTAVQAFQDTRKAALTIIGNMHIRTPQGTKTPTISTRRRLVREALGKLA